MLRSKRLSRNICLVLSFCIITAAMSFMPSTKAHASSADPNVQLDYVQKYDLGEASNYGYDGYVGYIDVKNLAYEKNVTVHYTTDGKSWQDISAEYIKADPEDPQYDVWKFSMAIPSSSLTFAIKYEVNGQTYWDNNEWNNYTVSPTAPIILGKCVLKTVKISENAPAVILLKNFAYEKMVFINYTTDNWATSNSVDANYEKSLSENIEQWKIPSSIPHGSNVKFTVTYMVNNVAYFDNNFGDYYTNY